MLICYANCASSAVIDPFCDYPLFECAVNMSEMQCVKEIDTRLASLRGAHRALDNRIEQMNAEGNGVTLELQRLKKQKLVLRDRIELLERQRHPDIIA